MSNASGSDTKLTRLIQAKVTAEIDDAIEELAAQNLIKKGTYVRMVLAAHVRANPPESKGKTR